MSETNNQLDEFIKMHNKFITYWNKALSSGDTSLLERMTENYYVAFFKSRNDKPIFFSKEEAISGMEQSVRHFLGANKRFENRVIRLRNNENAVVFYEQVIMKNGEVLARLFTIENWAFVKDKWMIVREIEEPIS